MVRIKRRYILLKSVDKNDKKSELNTVKFLDELKNKLACLFGDFGVACFNRGYAIKKQEPSHGMLILQVRRDVHEMVMAALPLCDVVIKYLSGTMRGCLKFMKQNYIMDLRAAIAMKLQKDKTSMQKRKDKVVELMQIDS